jgi:hypothetical protein
MSLRDTLEQGCHGVSVCAAEHAWRPSPSPWPTSSPLRGEEVGTWEAGANEYWQPSNMVAQARYVPDEKSGFLIRL